MQGDPHAYRCPTPMLPPLVQQLTSTSHGSLGYGFKTKELDGTIDADADGSDSEARPRDQGPGSIS